MSTSPWVKCSCIFISVSKWTSVAHVMKAQRLLRAKTALSSLMAPNTSCPNHLLMFWGVSFFFFFCRLLLNLLFKTRVQQDKCHSNCTLWSTSLYLLYSSLHAVFIPVCFHPAGWFVSGFVHVSNFMLMISILVFLEKCSNLKASRPFSHIFNLEVKGMYPFLKKKRKLL